MEDEIAVHTSADDQAAADYVNYMSDYVYVAVPPTLYTVNLGDGKVMVSWTPSGGTLWSSPALGLGPRVDWQPIGPANPAIVPLSGSAQFFRVHVQ